jgi:hypothetical protein
MRLVMRVGTLAVTTPDVAMVTSLKYCGVVVVLCRPRRPPGHDAEDASWNVSDVRPGTSVADGLAELVLVEGVAELDVGEADEGLGLELSGLGVLDSGVAESLGALVVAAGLLVEASGVGLLEHAASSTTTAARPIVRARIATTPIARPLRRGARRA